jgi:hypothetical protein
MVEWSAMMVWWGKQSRMVDWLGRMVRGEGGEEGIRR